MRAWRSNGFQLPRYLDLIAGPNVERRTVVPERSGDGLKAELSEALGILRALAELSAAQAVLDQNPEQATAPRDHYARQAVEAFRRFEAGAKSSKSPLTISIRLTPDANRHESTALTRGRRLAIEKAARTLTCKAAFASPNAMTIRY